ncbi:DNA-binding response regulator [Pseudoduganella sp. UC29_106]|uniref:response regulator transcription factor n=1 Tax=Pseudoduganella sp. UC29_106 TaxID=3374553 RepID=UPI003756E58F
MGEAIVRAGLAALLAQCPYAVVRDEAPPWHVGFVVVVTDYSDGMARLPQAMLRRERIMIVSQRDRECDVRAAMAAGVHGYLTHCCDAAELQAALHALGQGLRYFNKELLARARPRRPGCHLTMRESQVLELLATGCSNKRIALTLDISVSTVKTHLKSMFGKLGVSARTQAVVLATQQGLISHWSALHQQVQARR